MRYEYSLYATERHQETRNDSVLNLVKDDDATENLSHIYFLLLWWSSHIKTFVRPKMKLNSFQTCMTPIF